MGRALLVYAGATVAYTWPLALHPTTRLAAPVGPGDPFLYVWVLGWVMGTLLRNPLDVLNGRVFDANIFHPADSTLAYSDHLILQSIALAPIYAITGDAVLCYNVLLAASMLLSGMAMHAFALEVTGSSPAAYLAGLAWAFWPFRFAHLVHVQLQALYFLPLAFLFLHRLMAARRTRDALGLGMVLGLQGWSSVYYAVIGGVGTLAAALVLPVSIGRWRSARLLRQLALAAVVAVAIVAPVAWIYWQVQREGGFGRGLFEASRNAAAFRSYAQVPAENVLYGRTELLPSAVLEQALFPGLTVTVLAVAGALMNRRGDARPLVTAMLAVGALGLILSLGPDGWRGLYAFFQRYVFGFQAIRAPARFGVLVMFALTALAALELRAVAGRPRGRRLAAVAIALAGIEMLNVPMPLTAAPPRVTEVGQWLRRAPGPGAVVHLPITLDVASTPAMVQSLEHRRPLLNGYSGQRPEFYNALADSLASFPSDEALRALHESGVRFIVTAAPILPPTDDEAWPLVERASLADGVIYELAVTPEVEARLEAGLAIVPPPPGPLPFAVGEVSRYSAYWAGAGVNLAAGEITVAVKEPRFTFEARAVTAPWMARFFEARDTFVTRTNEELLPIVHERDLQEGSRHVERTFLYDREGRLVRIGRDAAQAAGVEAVTLPLAAWARDAVSAVFYVRTLPLVPGDRVTIPVNEAGRSLFIDLGVGGVETITVSGRPVKAIRLDPRLRRRVERRRPIVAVLWLSDDERRVPVAMDVEAAFGRVRLELVSYSP